MDIDLTTIITVVPSNGNGGLVTVPVETNPFSTSTIVDPTTGAVTTLYFATSPNTEADAGFFFANINQPLDIATTQTVAWVEYERIDEYTMSRVFVIDNHDGTVTKQIETAVYNPTTVEMKSIINSSTVYSVQDLNTPTRTNLTGIDKSSTVVGDARLFSYFANSATASLTGTAGDDAIVGKFPSLNIIDAGAGNDSIQGQAGSDTITGGAGNDAISGGYGRDTIYFSIGDGSDTLAGNNLNPNIAFIDYASPNQSYDLVFNGISINDVHAVRSGDNVTLFYGTNDSVTFFYPEQGTTLTPYSTAITSLTFSDSTTPISGEAMNSLINSNLLVATPIVTPIDPLNQFITVSTSIDPTTGQTSYTLLINVGDPSTYQEYFFPSTPRLSPLIARYTVIDDVTMSQLAFDINYDNSTVTAVETIATINTSTGNISYSSVSTIHTFSSGFLVQNPEPPITASWIGPHGNGFPPPFTTSLSGTASDDLVQGISTYKNILSGGEGNDTLLGQMGNDVLSGGAGNDLIQGGFGQDQVNFQMGDGNDTVLGDGSTGLACISLGGGIQAMYMLKQGYQLNFNGIQSNDVRATRVGDNITLTYGTNDSVTFYYPEVYLTGAAAGSLQPPAVNSLSFSNGNFSGSELKAILSSLLLRSGTSSNDNLIGLDNQTNIFYGLSGNDTLTGGNQSDTLNGGLGNDVLIGKEGADIYTFNVGDGKDTIIDVDTNIDNVDVVNINVKSTDIQSMARSGNNLVIKYTATDSVTIQNYFSATTDNRIEQIRFSDNVILGTAANEYQMWGTGGDFTLKGLAGNDEYVVDSLGDVVVENAGQGKDLVYLWGDTIINYTLGNNIENLNMTYSQVALTGTGNSLANLILGNDIDNTLLGLGGNDVIEAREGNDKIDGGSGNDLLWGQQGNDTMIGGLGADTMSGEAGDDVYYVDNIGDVVQELANSGIDQVISTISFDITNQTDFENITLSGGSAINAIGNAGNNVLEGNKASNILSGGAGNDVLRGGLGKDSLLGGDGDDLYLFARGDGVDNLTDSQGSNDVLQLTSGINSNQLWFRHIGNNLEIKVIGTTDSILINNWYASNGQPIESIKTADNKTLSNSGVEQLVNAMASFNPPKSGQTELPSNYQAALSTVLAANWH